MKTKKTETKSEKRTKKEDTQENKTDSCLIKQKKTETKSEKITKKLVKFFVTF